MTQSVDLEPAEWQQVISALAMTNPLLVKISSQLAASASAQARQMSSEETRQETNRLNAGNLPGNSKEPRHGL